MTTKILPLLSTKRNNYAIAAMNGKIYVAGGKRTGVVLNVVECYDPIANVWTTKCPMTHAREDFALVESSGAMYAIGSKKYIERYDSDQNKWTVVRRQIQIFLFFFVQFVKHQ